MNKLSTGEDNTLGNHLKIVVALLGDDSPAAEFLRKKIRDSPNGENEEVIADEGQMINLLWSIHTNGDGHE